MMKRSSLSSTNVSFDWLKGSSDFLDKILNNITCCVLLLDKNMRLQAFNDVLRTIFTAKSDEHLLYVKCGEAIGCAHQVEEQEECGNTSQCRSCDLRKAALFSYMNDEPVFKEGITRPFFNREGEKEFRHLNFSTRLFLHEREKYIILLIEDITELTDLRRKVVGLS